jgi:hypothetical protein
MANGNGAGGIVGQIPPAAEQGSQIRIELTGLDYQSQLAQFAMQGRFDIEPTVILMPFALLDLAQLQRLTHALVEAGVIQVPVVRT